MDTVAHALVGMAVGVLAQHSAAGPDGVAAADAVQQALFWGTLVAVQVPDLDLVTVLPDRLNHIRYHHGWTHSLAGAAVLSAAVAGWATWQWPGAAFGRLFPWYLAAMVFGHLVPDWLTAFGTRLLMPWSGRFMALDWLAQFEPAIWAVLLGADILALLHPANGHLWAGAGLALTAAFAGWRGWMHARVQSAVRTAYARDCRVVRVVVHPHPWRLNRYEYVVDTPEACHLGTALLDGRMTEHRCHRRPRPVPAWWAARRDRRMGSILRFTRNPVMRATPLPDGGYEIALSDFRGGCAFHFRVTLDRRLRVRSAQRAHTGA